MLRTGRSPGVARERLSDWWDVAYELHFVLTLYRSVQESLRTGSVEPIRSLEIDWSAIDWSSLTVDGSLPRDRPGEGLNREADTGEDYTDEMNLGLEDCEVGFLSLTMPGEEHNQPGKFGLQIAPQNLVGAAYASYASVIAKRQEIKECPGCGRMFFPESGRQKYCTKTCASTSRWRRWKARQSVD